MKRTKIWLAALMVAVLMLGSVAVAEDSDGKTLGDWLDGAVTSVETWARDSGILEVRGQAVRTVAPDTVAISVGATIANEDVKAAQDEANRIINDVIASLEALGVDEKQMMTSGYNISQRYNYSGATPVLAGYEARISLRVTLTDFELINDVLDVAVEKGANEIGGISFSYSDEGVIYRQALSDAINIAKAKAEAMAGTAGVGMYTLLEMREENNAMVTPMYTNSYAMAEGSTGGGGTQIKSGEIEISAYVTLTYQIK